MKILLTGATGYIALRLLPVLLDAGHKVVCCVRDTNRFDTSMYPDAALEAVEANFLKPESLTNIPNDIDAAYYLIHSMSATTSKFEELEAEAASHFIGRIAQTGAQQIIYLSGIVNEENLSRHLQSRKQVENILRSGTVPLTVLRAGIIVGSGSASFEIIRDLVEKLPVMIAPRWLNTTSQPIAIRNVIEFLSGVLFRESTYSRYYDIGGPEVLSYKEMLLRFARVRKLSRRIFIVPVMTPRLSSYWLYFVTATSYALACNLVDSMKVKVVCTPNNLAQELGISLIGYDQAISMAFDKLEQNQVLSSWKGALTSHTLSGGITAHLEVPVNGCFKDKRTITIQHPQKVLQKIWAIGGKNGWYFADKLWSLRGLMDKLVGGPGLRRGRRHPTELSAGESLDFWRVLLASKPEKRLLLYAEMKLPGEAWLEFRILEDNLLVQTATFRPRGILGRLYWYAVLPFHSIIFKGMIRKMAA
jgi:uncharacterized protein YbjT (DUF2867 family)